jgi:thiamine biosynthesis lipoprotein ApbE
MVHSARIAAYLMAALLWGAGPRLALATEDYEYYHENVMGTSMELRVLADDEKSARWAEERVLREIDRLNAIFSGYDATSELSRWQAAAKAPLRVSPELFDVLQEADRWRSGSEGAFDPRVEALTRLWSSCARQDRLPSPEELSAARVLVGRATWRLDPLRGTVERLSDCPLSLDGIAKGFIVERACDLAWDQGRGVRGLMLNVGGDLRVRGAIEGTIGIAAPWADSESTEPFAVIAVKDRSVATSGSSQRGFRINGRWYSHVFDPRSGLPVHRVVSATVIAERSVDADAFAKVCNVLVPEDSLRMARSLPGVECLIITRDGRAARSDGWHRYERPHPAPNVESHGLFARGSFGHGLEAHAPAAGLDASGPRRPAPGVAEGTGWNKEFELVVNFEINRPDGETGRYRRPYVAIWVEDKDGNSVRTLTLWVSMGGAGPFQWLPDLKRWYTQDKERKRRDKKELFFTISRPTRPPGKYKVIWDGKDDHGKVLPAGEYTVYVEAAREHGTYQSIRKPVTLSDQPFTEELKGNVEIRSASIEYRRKGPAK